MSLAHASGHQWGLASIPTFPAIVFVVDGDVPVPDSLELLIRCEGWQLETFESAPRISRPAAIFIRRSGGNPCL